MIDLSTISTAELVAELSKRDGVIAPHPELWFGIIDSMFKSAFSRGTLIPKILVIQQ